MTQLTVEQKRIFGKPDEMYGRLPAYLVEAIGTLGTEIIQNYTSFGIVFYSLSDKTAATIEICRSKVPLKEFDRAGLELPVSQRKYNKVIQLLDDWDRLLHQLQCAIVFSHDPKGNSSVDKDLNFSLVECDGYSKSYKEINDKPPDCALNQIQFFIYRSLSLTSPSFLLIDGAYRTTESHTLMILEAGPTEENHYLALEKNAEEKPEIRSHFIRELFRGTSTYGLIKAFNSIRENGIPEGLEQAVAKACIRHLLSEHNTVLEHIEYLLDTTLQDTVISLLEEDAPCRINSLLDSANPAARKLGVLLLFLTGTNIEPTRLKQLMNDPEAEVRARLAVVALDLKAERKTDLIRCLIADSSPMVRFSFLRGLGGVEDKIPFDFLAPLLDDPSAGIRAAAIELLANTDKPNAEIFDILFSFVQDDDEDIRRTAFEVLPELGVPGESAIDTFHDLMHAHDPETRELAVCAFVGCFSNNETAQLIDKIARLLYDPNDDIVGAAARVIMFAGNETHIPLLKEVYTENPLSDIERAIWVLSGDYRSLEKEAKSCRPLSSMQRYLPLIERAKDNYKKKKPEAVRPIAVQLDEIKPKGKMKHVSDGSRLRYNPSHPMGIWIKNLQQISAGDAVAYISQHWPFENKNYRKIKNWPTDGIRLARMLYLLNDDDVKEILDFFADNYYGSWDEEALDDYGMQGDEKKIVLDWVKALKEPRESLLKNAGIQLVKPRFLFSVSCETESLMSYSSWGWSTTAFTSDFALISEWEYWDGDDLNITTWIPIPLGLISRKKMFRSAALLLQHCGDLKTEEDPFVEQDYFWQSIRVRGIDSANVYRLLLAASGRGGEKILWMSESDLKKFQESDMNQDYRDLVKVTSEIRSESA